MKYNNLPLIVGAFIFIIGALIGYIGSDDSESQEEYISEFDELEIEELNSELLSSEPNTFLVSCDTVIRYWENINTEEQFTNLEVHCDTLCLFCDSSEVGGVTTYKCDTLYTIEN
jgi:hypothetical protein